uniref:Uncharacterized protein n=1 Tax=Caenorhabditis tropicalis TaxID=1561998 RepID=A0A1I7UNC5_9PELO
MEIALHINDDEEETAAELSEIELEDLVTTKFIEKSLGEDDGAVEKIETARAAGSPMEFCLSPIGREPDDFLLEEHPCLVRPIQEEVKIDEAVQLLNRILRSSEKDLKKYKNWEVFENSRRWKNTTRASESNLISSMLPLVDHRPTHLHVWCRRLIESDLTEIINNAFLLVDPPTQRSSLFRISLKTEMPLKQFLGQLGKMVSLSSDIQVKDTWVTALKQNQDGSNQKLITEEVGDFAELENKMMKINMIASVRIPFENVRKPFVSITVGYRNEFDCHGRRNKTITIEQHVTPLSGSQSNKRVTFGTPLIEAIHTFEIGENLPFHPLRFPHKIQNLIQFLESLDPSFTNVTFRK